MRGVDAFRLRKFDEAVVAAYTAPADLSLLRPFLASLRELLDARIANFVFYRDNRRMRRSAFTSWRRCLIMCPRCCVSRDMT